MKKNLKNYFAIALTVAILGASSMVKAETSTSEMTSSTLVPTESNMNMQEKMEQTMNKYNTKGRNMHFISSDILDEKTVQTVHEYMRSNHTQIKQNFGIMTEKERKAHFETKNQDMQVMFDNMVKDGILTQQQADQLKQIKAEDTNFMIKTKGMNFDKFVTNNILTQEVADKANAFMEAEHKELQQKLENMTEKERKAHFEAREENREQIFTKMVSNGILTQQQADQIKQIKPEDRNFMMKTKGMNFDKFVTNNILTQEVADKANAFMKAEHKELQQKLENMTEEERKAHFEAREENREQIFTKMVQNGILTQQQADQMKQIKPQIKSSTNKQNLA